MRDLVERFKYGKWALIVLALYFFATVMDTLLLHSNITEHLKLRSDVTSHIISELTTFSLFNFIAGTLFGSLAGVFFYRRKLQKGD